MNKSREKANKNLGQTLPKSRGKEVEFRSKKQKNELHMLKMSQEWDLRRQKRRLDRQKWVEERRNQKLPIWQRVGNLRVQANEAILDESGNELVNKKHQIENSNEANQTRDAHDDKVKENSLEHWQEEVGSEFRVQTSHLPVSAASGTSFIMDQREDPEIKFIKIEQAKTIERPLLYNVNALKTSKTPGQLAEHGSIAALKTTSKSPGHELDEKHCESETSLEKAPEGSRRGELAAISLKNLLQLERSRDVSTNGEQGKVDSRKRKLDAMNVDSDFREMPSLMRVDKPTTLESIQRENGPVTISSSVNDSVMMKPARGKMDRNENGKGDEPMPQIKQCYSLLEGREETPNVNFFAAKKAPNSSLSPSVSMATPVTMTTASSEVKGQGSLPSVQVDPKSIVYLSKSQVPVSAPSGSPNHPRPGYLVPVYKASTRETAYAFLPTGASRPHRVMDAPGLEGRSPSHKSDYRNVGCATKSHHATHSYPCSRPTAGLNEVHTGCVAATGRFVPSSKTPPALYSSQSTRVHSCYEPSSTAGTLNTSRPDSAYTNGGLVCVNSKNHASANLHYLPTEQHKTTNAYSVGSPEAISSSPPVSLAQEIKGVQATPEKLNYPAFSRTTEAVPNQTALNSQEAIFNPMSLYVRAKLVPREVVALSHEVESSPPLVEYIKTDAICDKELTKWNARNVADFIAATDCADKAELFLEQEIDGKALLSLSPEMLMKGMNLKLGPSVKLFNHITNLRTALLL